MLNSDLHQRPISVPRQNFVGDGTVAEEICSIPAEPRRSQPYFIPEGSDDAPSSNLALQPFQTPLETLPSAPQEE